MARNVVFTLNREIKMLIKFYLEEARNVFLPLRLRFYMLIWMPIQKVKLKAKLISYKIIHSVAFYVETKCITNEMAGSYMKCNTELK